MIIKQYQQLGYDALASYGCMTTFAIHLDLDEDSAILGGMFDKTQERVRRMTAIATRTGANQETA